MDNLVPHLQCLSLGARCRRRTNIPTASPAVDPHACMRRLLARAFRSDDKATFQRQHPASGCATPIFQVAYARGAQRLLAAVDEEGVVSLIDTVAMERPTETQAGVFQRVHHAWQAHENAIFDLAWARDDAYLLTASGDLRATAWDVETQHAVYTLANGHAMSVKCVRASDDHADVIATGARDGHVMIWDARTPSKPIAQLRGVHSVPTPPPIQTSSQSPNVHFVSPVGSRKRRKTEARPPPASSLSSSPRSVTSVAFLGGGHELATAGAVDGVVKIWDLRRLTAPRKIPLASNVNTASTPVRSFACGGNGNAKRAQRGITSLALDPVSRSRLLVSVLHDELCVLDPHARIDPVVVRLEGHAASSFYVKAAFSPDGDFVASGSGDGNVYLWDLRRLDHQRESNVSAPTLALKAHDAEVNGVAWHANDFSKLATCGDDGTVRVWTPDRHASETDSFALRRRRSQWENWYEWETQERGRAYTVEAMEENEEVKKVGHLSPPVVRRNPEALADRQEPDVTPRKRRSQTLLDFWGR